MNSEKESYKQRLFSSCANPNDSLTIARLDNAEIDFDAIKKYVKNR